MAQPDGNGTVVRPVPPLPPRALREELHPDHREHDASNPPRSSAVPPCAARGVHGEGDRQTRGTGELQDPGLERPQRPADGQRGDRDNPDDVARAPLLRPASRHGHHGDIAPEVRPGVVDPVAGREAPWLTAHDRIPVVQESVAQCRKQLNEEESRHDHDADPRPSPGSRPPGRAVGRRRHRFEPHHAPPAMSSASAAPAQRPKSPPPRAP